jgi:serine/threonine protein kinase
MTERDIFLAALDLPDRAARAAYLDQVCQGDAALRRQVEALLRSHDNAGSFLGRPAVASPDPNAAATSDFGLGATPGDRATSEQEALTFLTESVRADSLGRIGHYEVLEILGRGGFGIVFRAFDEVLQRMVAVKVLAPQMAATSPARKRFLREAQSSARVRHENVVQVYAVAEQPLPYLVMEFIPGETLQGRLNRTGPLEVEEVVRIGRQIAEGLAAAHAQGLIHRDIKPANVIIEAGPQQRVKLTDFGLARAADDASLSQSGVVAGTPMFMSPEQANGEALDHRADLFSLGSVLYTMCSGRPPFRASSTLAVLRRVAEDAPRPIKEIIPEVPQWLCDLIARLHAKKPEDRIASAGEVADLLTNSPTQLQPPRKERPEVPDNPALAPAASPVLRRSPWKRYFAAVAGIVVLGLAGLGFAEALGVTNLHGTVIRLFSPEGTLVVEVDDPGIRVTIDGEEMSITGAGVKEIRLKPGEYKVTGSKSGRLVSQELVTVTRNGRRVVRVSREGAPAEEKPVPVKVYQPAPDAAEWEKSVALLPGEAQVKAVVARLKKLNPNFNGQVTPTLENGIVTGLEFRTDFVGDISPVRALTGLQSLTCLGPESDGKVTDLSALKGMRLRSLNCTRNPVSDLAPLRDMPLESLVCRASLVSDLAPLAGMKLTNLDCGASRVADLSPLKGMKLKQLVVDNSPVSDLSPVRGMPLELFHCGGSGGVSDLSPLTGMALTELNCRGTKVSTLSPLRGMPLTVLNCDFEPDRDLEVLLSLKSLKFVNWKPVAEFWKDVGR